MNSHPQPIICFFVSLIWKNLRLGFQIAWNLRLEIFILSPCLDVGRIFMGLIYDLEENFLEKGFVSKPQSLILYFYAI